MLLIAAPGLARERPPDPPQPAPVRHTAAATDTALLAAYTFDGPGDTPDPQGWETVDMSVEDVYFHVDDFAGMPAPYAPLEGTRSLWCGARAGGALCHYNALPGYGNSWVQYFESIEFSVTGDVHVDCLVRYDLEPGYDFAWVEYLSKTGSWRGYNFATALNGVGAGLYANVIPADSLAGTTRIRLRVTSDGAFSDEEGLFPTDGAVEFDSLTVWDANGVLDFEDFEDEAIGATSTMDGDWYAFTQLPFGDHAALFDGDTILQEDSLTFNHSHVWGFFNNSPDDMGCLGHPEQPVPPGPLPLFEPQVPVFHNEARSPAIDLQTDMNGMPVPWDAQTLVVDFDLYGDIQLSSPGHPVPNHVSYDVRASYLVDGCWRPGRGSSNLNEIDGRLDETIKAWIPRRASATIPDGATHVRISLAVFEFNNDQGPHCHTAFPLYDNVEVRVVTEFTTAAGPAAPQTHLEQNHPNPFNPVTTIGYSLAANGHVSLRIYDVKGALLRTLVDGAQSADDGPFRVEWDGRAEDGAAVASGVYFYRLEAAGVVETRRMVLLK